MEFISNFNQWIFYAWFAFYSISLWWIFVIVYVLDYFVNIVKKPVLNCGHRDFATFVMNHCPVVQQRFWVNFWCIDGRLQTIFCYFLRELIPNINYTRRELIISEDGQPIALDWLETKESINNPNHPTMLILPGLNGDNQSNYVKPYVLQSEGMGYRSIVFNHRGKAGVTLCTPTFFSPVDYKDFHEVVLHVKKILPNSPLLAVGTSFGAIVLGQYVCHMGDQSQLEAAILVSSVYDFDGIHSLESHPVHVYFSKVLSDSLIKDIQPYKDLFEGCPFNFEDVLKSQTLTEFGSTFLAPLHGYENVDQLYKLANLNNKLKYCKTPLLGICSNDDPYQPRQYLPSAEDIDGAPVAIVVAPNGGHLGFQEGLSMLKPSWAEHLFVQFCQAIIKCRPKYCEKDVSQV